MCNCGWDSHKALQGMCFTCEKCTHTICKTLNEDFSIPMPIHLTVFSVYVHKLKAKHIQHILYPVSMNVCNKEKLHASPYDHWVPTMHMVLQNSGTSISFCSCKLVFPLIMDENNVNI